MLNERLRLAKQLLKDDGVIFVSIDDNEQAYLKVLMDEIFGEENFVVNFKWNKTSTPPSLSNKIRHKYEYILCYEKTKTNNIFSVGEISGGDMPLLNSINPIKCIHFQRQMVKFNFNGDLKKGKYNGCILHDDIFIKKIMQWMILFWRVHSNELKKLLMKNEIMVQNLLLNQTICQ